MKTPSIDISVRQIKNLVQQTISSSTGASAGFGPGFVNATVAAGADGYRGQAYKRITIAAGSAGYVPAPNADLFGQGANNFGVSTLGMSALTDFGKPYSIAVPVRSSIAQKVHCQAQGITATTGGSVLNGPDVTLVPGVWTLLICENFIPFMRASAPIEPTLGVRVDVDVATTGGVAWSQGDTFDVGRAYVFAGAKLPEVVCDGDVPGWRWLGTPNGSESVGYPYTLESIAGPQLARYAVASLAGLADGAAVAAWEDLSGNGYNLSQGVGSKQPIFKRASGRPVVSFDGVDDVLAAAASAPLPVAGTMLMVARTQATLSTSTRYGGVRAVAGTTSGFWLGGNTTGHVAAVRLDDGTFPSVTKIVDTTKLAVISGQFDPSSPLRVGVDASFANETGSKPYAPIAAGQVAPMSLGGISSFFAPIDVCEVVLLDHAHNDETVKRTTAWLARKYGTPIPTGY